LGATGVSIFTFSALLLVMAAAPLWAQAPPAAPTSFSVFRSFNPPPFDFNNAFYTANGIDFNKLDTTPAQRFGIFRQTGPPAATAS